MLALSVRLGKALPGITIREPVNQDDELKLYCSRAGVNVKVEVNTINRGVSGATVIMPLCEKARTTFGSYIEMQLVPVHQLFGGKLVAALDRQHPRDLFDCRNLFNSDEEVSNIVKGFIFCMLSSKRPFHELLQPHFIDQRPVFNSQFHGMTNEEFTWDMFEKTRLAIVNKVRSSFTMADKELLRSFASGKPEWIGEDWSVYPGIRWKLQNILKLKATNNIKFRELQKQLDDVLEQDDLGFMANYPEWTLL
ncbi:MAG: nucleotidyl transferase AbiEii/AbiGii toxin family protein [Bacteroidales bacterium]|nr:nucleotidyl transferase AbiEii/AbiGii toxin family protein [Bacteroidales bacterium]